MADPASVRGHLPLLGRTTLILLLTCHVAGGCASVSKSPAATPAPVSSEQESAPSYVIPAIEIIGMNAAINLAGRRLVDPAAFQVTPKTIKRNLDGPWVVEDDPFEVNQFLHPYQGAMYHNIARSTGHNYWQSFAYTFAGSALWEIAGETTRPSKNDQIASGIAGTFLGEPLFRISRMILDRGNRGPGVWRVLAATLVSPPTGINHMMFGDHYDPARSDVLAASDIRIQIGVAAPLTGNVRSLSALDLDTQLIGFSMDYGFPGKSGYAHARPFDYFRIDGIASADGLESLETRGLLAGKDYSAGDAGRGVWGLYGSYDYFAPDVFRISSTALSFGTTSQSWLSDSLTLHSTALLGVGYTAAQALDRADDGDYHYGVAPQAVVSLRLIAGRRAALDVTAREYLISDVAGFGTRQRDVILRGDASLALRLYRQHAIAIKYLLSRRDATHPELPRMTQTRSTVGVFYTFLGSGGFGAIR